MRLPEGWPMNPAIVKETTDKDGPGGGNATCSKEEDAESLLLHTDTDGMDTDLPDDSILDEPPGGQDVV